MPRILIVDDDTQNVNALKRELQDRNPMWTISTASGEREAGSEMREHCLDVIITDLKMAQEQSGMEVLREAKSRDPLLMVIMITAFEKLLERYRAFELGAFDCIQKNTPGLIASEEIYIKTQAALRFRELAIQQVDNEKRLGFLRRYFDPRIYGAIEKNPEILAAKNQIVSISFWDIRGFSKLCENMKAYPKLIAGFLQDYFGIAAEVIFQHRGVLDKYIGDGVMGLFGALDCDGDEGREDAIHAVRAALDLQGRFEDLLEKWTEQWTFYSPQKVDIGLGCGIHTGEALVGNLGTTLRDQYTAIGANVNFAQRIEARANKGEILVSASTEARIRDSFEVSAGTIINDVKNIPGDFMTFLVSNRPD